VAPGRWGDKVAANGHENTGPVQWPGGGKSAKEGGKVGADGTAMWSRKECRSGLRAANPQANKRKMPPKGSREGGRKEDQLSAKRVYT